MPTTGRYSGKDVYVTFGGTVVSGDLTGVKRNEADDQIDVTAGSETSHYKISLGRADGNMDLDAFWDGSTITVWNAILPGNAGTLIVAPRGTATGMPRWTWSRALVSKRDITLPFDGAIEVSASFEYSSLCTEAVY
jgi:hypothetical protein